MSEDYLLDVLLVDLAEEAYVSAIANSNANAIGTANTNAHANANANPNAAAKANANSNAIAIANANGDTNASGIADANVGANAKAIGIANANANAMAGLGKVVREADATVDQLTLAGVQEKILLSSCIFYMPAKCRWDAWGHHSACSWPSLRP